MFSLKCLKLLLVYSLPTLELSLHLVSLYSLKTLYGCGNVTKQWGLCDIVQSESKYKLAELSTFQRAANIKNLKLTILFTF